MGQNILLDLVTPKEEVPLTSRLFKKMELFFEKRKEKVYFLRKHDDMSFPQGADVRIKEVCRRSLIVAKLDPRGNELFTTGINYASLLDRNNQKDEYVWQLEYID